VLSPAGCHGDKQGVNTVKYPAQECQSPTSDLATKYAEALRSWKTASSQEIWLATSRRPAQLRDGNNHKFPNQRLVNPETCVTILYDVR